MQHEILPNDVIRECLERSGYLLESSIVRELGDRGFFVEPNQVAIDIRTGKSRELDIIAEHHSYNADHHGTRVKTQFIAEVINNRYPVVLLTKRPSTPNSSVDSYVKYACTPESNEFYKHFDLHADRSPPQERLFAQYCALSLKKGDKREFMASHPDDMYSSLQKVAEYAEHEFEQFAQWAAGSRIELICDSNMSRWRIFFWYPMLVLGGQLVAVEDSESASVSLSEVTSAFLEFNWHKNDEQRTTVVEVITLAGLYERMEAIVALDQELEVELHALHLKSRVESV